MINYQKAKNILKKAKIKIQDENILIKNSLNRVVSRDVFSPSNHPLGNNAAFDGFAINSKDTKYAKKNNLKYFKIVGSIAAGTKPLKKKIKKFESVEIMTGGIVHKPFNTIIPIEQIIFYPNKKNPKSIIINKKINKYNHVRFKGSDYNKGDIIVKNSMTSEMVKYLFMEDEELSKKIGSSTPQRYRTYIIQTLSSLWD